MCAGTVSVTAPLPTTAPPPPSLSGDLKIAMRAVLCGVCDAVGTAHMSLQKLLCVRLYYVNNATTQGQEKSSGSGSGSGTLHDKLTCAYQEAALELQTSISVDNTRVRVPPVTLVPVTHLPATPTSAASEDAAATTVLVAHFWAVDLVQHSTERWILGANNFNDSSGK